MLVVSIRELVVGVDWQKCVLDDLGIRKGACVVQGWPTRSDQSLCPQELTLIRIYLQRMM